MYRVRGIYEFMSLGLLFRYDFNLNELNKLLIFSYY